VRKSETGGFQGILAPFAPAVPAPQSVPPARDAFTNSVFIAIPVLIAVVMSGEENSGGNYG
jgi:hypothetical protein